MYMKKNALEIGNLAQQKVVLHLFMLINFLKWGFKFGNFMKKIDESNAPERTEYTDTLYKRIKILIRRVFLCKRQKRRTGPVFG